MKKKVIWLAAVLLLILFACTGCFGRIVTGTLRVSGPHTTLSAVAETEEDSYALSLRGLVFLVGDDVTLTVKPADGPARVEVDCAEALVSRHGLQVAIEGDKILIKSRTLRTLTTDSFHVTVYAPCNRVLIEGAYRVDIDASGVSSFELDVNGAADGKIYNLDVTEADCDVDGAAELTLEGKADTFACGVNGAADVEAKGLTAREVKLTLNGTGDITVTATEALSATINGAGSIGYYGSPADVRQQINGAGSIRPLS